MGIHSNQQTCGKTFRRAQTQLSIAALLFAFSASGAFGQGTPRTTLGPTVQVYVEDSNGRPFENQANIVMTATGGNGEYKTETRSGAAATIRNVTPADYMLEVTSDGYETARERLLVNGGNSYVTVHIAMRELRDAMNSAHAPQAPVLAGKSKKELDQAVAALRKGKIDDAMHHLEYPLEHANADPTVQYVAGVCAEDSKDYGAARQHFETAVSVFPEYFNAQLDLGTLLLQQLSDAPDAIPHLNEALALDPNSWRGHWLL